MRRMRLPIRSSNRASPAGARARTRAFTLVELLVVLTIIVILVGLTLGAFRRSPADRLNASARQLQSRILLARSIAARDQRVTGLRLVQSDNDPWVVDTVEMIKSPGYVSGTLGSIQYVNGRWVVVGEFHRLVPPSLPLTTGGTWALNANGRNLIRPGTRIEIPEGTGRWYTVGIPDDLNLNGVLDPGEDVGLNGFNYEQDALVLNGHYTPSVWDSAASTYVAQPAVNVPYRLELAPTVTAGEEPLRLDPGTAIDLVASLNVPGFRYAITAPSTTPPSAGDLEILFSPGQGLNSESAAGGNIYLYISTLEDIELTRQLAPNHPANGTGSPVAAPIVPANPPSAPKTEPSALAIIAQTGNVISVPVDLTPSGNLASDPYSYARNGREANR